MNRHYCLIGADRKPRIHPGIKLVGVFSQGAPTVNETSQRNYAWFLADFENRGMVLVDTLVATGLRCGRGALDGGALERPETVLEQCYVLLHRM